MTVFSQMTNEQLLAQYQQLRRQRESGMRPQTPLAPVDPTQARQAAVNAEKSLVEGRTAVSRYVPLRRQLDQFDRLNEEIGTGPIYKVPFAKDVRSMADGRFDIIEGIASSLQGQARPAGSGATSDFEQRLYRMGVPSPEKMGEANASITAHMRATIDEESDRLSFYEQYLAKNNTLRGAVDAWQRYTAENPYVVMTDRGLMRTNRNRQGWQEYFGLAQPTRRQPARARPQPPRRSTGRSQILAVDD